MIPMITRPLDMIYGPPDPDKRFVPVVPGGSEIWLAPVGPFEISTWAINPGTPGGLEFLPWKRKP